MPKGILKKVINSGRFKKGMIPFNKGKKMSDEVRKNMSDAHKGYHASDETKRKLSIIKKGKPFSQKAREASRIASIGSHRSDEAKRKISEANKGNKYCLGKKLSEEHKRKISIANGSKKGWITPENFAIRASAEYKLWRKSCFERDNFTCQKTEQKGGKLVVHHINNFANFPELRTSINNGITLSEQAHREFHKLYGIKNNTKEQLINFLNY